MSYTWKLLLVVVSLMGSIALQGAAQAESPTKLSIGALYHLTGEFALQGEAFRRGTELAKLELAKGEGSPSVLFEDTQYLPRQVASSSQRLVGQKVNAALVSTVTEAKVAAPILLRSQIPMVVLWDTSPELERLGSSVFGIGPWTPASGQVAADFSYDTLKAKKAVVITSAGEWSLSIGSAFAAQWKRREGATLVEIEFPPTEIDFKSVLARIKNERPDVIYAVIDANIPAFFKQLRQQKIPAPVITSDIITDDYFEGASAQDFEGVYQTMPRVLASSALTRLGDLYQQHFGSPLTQAQFVAWGYDGVLVLHEASKIFARKRAASLSDAIRQVNDLQGMSGVISFRGGQSSPNPLAVYQVQKGAFVEP